MNFPVRLPTITVVAGRHHVDGKLRHLADLFLDRHAAKKGLDPCGIVNPLWPTRIDTERGVAIDDQLRKNRRDKIYRGKEQQERRPHFHLLSKLADIQDVHVGVIQVFAAHRPDE